MIFIVVDQQIDDPGPTLKSSAAADEEVLFVEYLQNLIFNLFDKQHVLFLYYTQN